MTKFEENIKQKSDAELQEYLNNQYLYRKESILTVIEELEKRGKADSDSEAAKKTLSNEIESENRPLLPRSTGKIPNTISKAAKLLYISASLGIINPIIAHLTTEIENFNNTGTLTVIIFSVVLIAVLGYQVGLGKKGARTVLLVLFLLGTMSFPSIIMDSFELSIVIGVMSLGQFVIQGYALILLFTRDSKKWYSGGKPDLKELLENEDLEAV